MSEIIKGFPALFWNCSVDPDENLGGGLKEYSVYISTDSLFSKIDDTAHLSPKVCEYQTKNLENHCTYFWRIVALDVDGLESSSYQIGSFIVDLGNAPPKPPLLLSPKGKDIINPSDYLVWQLQDDPDKHDKVSCEISIFNEKESGAIITEFLSDSLFELARSNIIPGSMKVYKTESGQNFIKIKELLEDNKRWFYRVRAFDGHGEFSEWSLVNTFITNAVKESPLQVKEGFLPKDSMIVDTRKPLVSWLPTSDPDPGQTERDLYYIVQYFRSDDTKKVKQVKSKLSITSIHLPLLKEEKYYVYQVAAVDPDGKNPICHDRWFLVLIPWINHLTPS